MECGSRTLFGYVFSTSTIGSIVFGFGELVAATQTTQKEKKGNHQLQPIIPSMRYKFPLFYLHTIKLIYFLYYILVVLIPLIFF